MTYRIFMKGPQHDRMAALGGAQPKWNDLSSAGEFWKERLLANRYGLQIRSAQGNNAPGLVELLGSTGWHVPLEVLADRLEALHRSNAGAVLIAVEWGPPTGFIALNWFLTLGDDLQVAQIDMLLVLPDDRRRGVGRLLLKATSQAARTAGCGSMRLVATASADRSVAAFCDATGFTADGDVYARALRKKA